MRQKNKRPVNWMLRTAAILMCLVAASLYLVTGLYARYTTSTTGSDGARVAKFEISTGGDLISGNPFQVTMKPGDTGAEKRQTRTVTVQNNSEVAVECILTAENKTGNLPVVLTWVNGDTTITSNTLCVDLAARDTASHTYTLQIDWPEDANDVKYSREVDHIVVTILCQQID